MAPRPARGVSSSLAGPGARRYPGRVSGKRNRAARALMAETGWNYTRALREIDRRQEDGMGEPDSGPLEETRGGENIDWEHAEPGKPLREKPDPDIIRGIERVTGETYDPETGQWHAR